MLKITLLVIKILKKELFVYKNHQLLVGLVNKFKFLPKREEVIKIGQS